MVDTRFDLGASALRGQALGRADRARQSENALQQLLSQTPPTTSENRQALQSQAFTSGLSPDQSFALVGGLAQMDQAQRARLKEKTAQAARLAFTVKQLPPSQRAQGFQAIRQQLPDVFDQDVRDQASLDFALDSTINEAMSLSDLFKQAEGFTLKPGEERFDVRGRVIASRADDKPPPKLTDVAGLRKEFTAASNDFVKVRDAFGKVQKAAAAPSAANDLALIFNFMKMLDPGSVVREGEFATAQNTAGVDDRVRNVYNRLRSGERLADAQRQEFVASAQGVFQSQANFQKQLENTFRGIAERQGFDPRNVVSDFLGDLRNQDQPAGGTQSAAALPEGTIASNGQETLIVRNGKWVPFDGQ